MMPGVNPQNAWDLAATGLPHWVACVAVRGAGNFVCMAPWVKNWVRVGCTGFDQSWGGKTMATQFIVHDKIDTVGVVVVEDVQPGKDLTGWIMQTDETIMLKALDAVPLGHKIALHDLKTGDTVMKN